MILSKERLRLLSEESGFRDEMIEKVILLMDLLAAIVDNPLLKNQFVLKGGTALNLFYFGLPRLSIDIDLNYIGAIPREEMLANREKIEAVLIRNCEAKGFQLARQPTVHAGGKMVWRYPSALGHQGNLEIDLNYMYRVTLWPVVFMSSKKIGQYSVSDVPVLDFYELAAGKISALFDRIAGRDLFDTHFLLSKDDLDFEKLRLAVVVYAAMNRKKNFQDISIENINFDATEFKNRVEPMLSNEFISKVGKISIWAEELLAECKEKLAKLFPLRANELQFLSEACNGHIKPELITNDPILIKNIQLHPALHWRVKKENQ